jgi:hypothetical protein
LHKARNDGLRQGSPGFDEERLAYVEEQLALVEE